MPGVSEKSSEKKQVLNAAPVNECEAATASHQLDSIIITHAHTETQAEKTIKHRRRVYVCKCTRRHHRAVYSVCVCLCAPVFLCLCVSGLLQHILFFPPHISFNACCEICICAFLDFCQETCYVDITLPVAATSR